MYSITILKCEINHNNVRDVTGEDREGLRIHYNKNTFYKESNNVIKR